jgi:hypothetical protein
MTHTDPAIFFSIPFGAYRSPDQWSAACSALRLSLQSVFDQTYPNVMALVCGHDRPDIPELSDSRVAFFQSPFPRPDSLDRASYDKDRNRIVTADYVRRQGGGYIAFLDADDMMSRRLCQAVVEDAQESVFLAAGYCLDWQTGAVAHIPGVVRGAFYTFCGSCAVLKFDVSELPILVGDKISNPDSLFVRLGPHQVWPVDLQRAGKKYGELSFPAAIYVLYNGCNVTFEQKNSSGDWAWLRPAVDKYRAEDMTPILEDFPCLVPVMAGRDAGHSPALGSSRPA